jgi:hypothetical protein
MAKLLSACFLSPDPQNRLRPTAMTISGTIVEQIQKAVNAHGVWKVKLSQMVDSGTMTMTPDQARADNQCPLGQWLYGPLDPALKASDHYQTVIELHARFHQAAVGIVVMSLARKRTEALEAMEFGSTFKQFSAKLVLELSAWGDEVNAQRLPTGG